MAFENKTSGAVLDAGLFGHGVHGLPTSPVVDTHHFGALGACGLGYGEGLPVSGSAWCGGVGAVPSSYGYPAAPVGAAWPAATHGYGHTPLGGFGGYSSGGALPAFPASLGLLGKKTKLRKGKKPLTPFLPSTFGYPPVTSAYPATSCVGGLAPVATSPYTGYAGLGAPAFGSNFHC